MKKVLLASLFALSVSNVAYADDIIDSVAADSSLKTLGAALKTAGLTDTLKGDGPFTVFAPSDAAFAKLPKDKLDALLKDKEALSKLLLAHVVSHKITAEDVQAGKVKSIEGHELKLDVSEGVKIDGVPTVGGSDIKADNGMIYVLDTVLMQDAAGKKKVSNKKKVS